MFCEGDVFGENGKVVMTAAAVPFPEKPAGGLINIR